MNWIRVALVSVLLVLSGCVSTHKTSEWVYPPMAFPLQPSIQQEIQLSRLTQLLQRSNINNEVRAKMFYERGLIYDSLGLRDLARVDFTQSLNLKPDQSSVFNILGVFDTQSQDFDNAYEAFDSALELDPSDQYVERNLAIALYYGSRYKQAYELAEKHYNDEPTDPYRAIWLYWISLEIDPTSAKNTFKDQYQKRSDDKFGWQLAGMILNEIPEHRFFQDISEKAENNMLLVEQLTEGYFYLGKRYQYDRQYSAAIALYKLALAGNMYEFVEHRYSFIELSKTFKELRALQKKSTAAKN